jgi:hypothetical protein
MVPSPDGLGQAPFLRFSVLVRRALTEQPRAGVSPIPAGRFRATTALQAACSSRVLDQDSPHGRRRRGKELGPTP